MTWRQGVQSIYLLASVPCCVSVMCWSPAFISGGVGVGGNVGVGKQLRSAVISPCREVGLGSPEVKISTVVDLLETCTYFLYNCGA